MIRLFVYIIILVILLFIPLSYTNTNVIKINKITSNSVKISLVNQTQKKPKKQLHKIKKTKPKPKKKPKPKPKKILKPKPKPIEKPKEIVEPKEILKPTLVEEVFEKEELLTQTHEEIIEPTMDNSYEIKQTYYSYIRSTLDKKKKYPLKAKRFKHQGDVKISFVINDDGSVNSLEITEPSRYNTLNKAIKDMFKNLKFEKPPKEIQRPIKISIPINFTLK